MPTLSILCDEGASESSFHAYPMSKNGASCEVVDAQRLQHRDAQLERPDRPVIGHELVLAIAAHGPHSADGDLLDREQRLAGELQVDARDQL